MSCGRKRLRRLRGRGTMSSELGPLPSALRPWQPVQRSRKMASPRAAESCAHSHRILLGNIVRLKFAARFLHEGGKDVFQNLLALLVGENVAPARHGGPGDALFESG